MILPLSTGEKKEQKVRATPAADIQYKWCWYVNNSRAGLTMEPRRTSDVT